MKYFKFNVGWENIGAYGYRVEVLIPFTTHVYTASQKTVFMAKRARSYTGVDYGFYSGPDADPIYEVYSYAIRVILLDRKHNDLPYSSIVYNVVPGDLDTITVYP